MVLLKSIAVKVKTVVATFMGTFEEISLLFTIPPGHTEFGSKIVYIPQYPLLQLTVVSTYLAIWLILVEGNAKSNWLK